MFICFKYKVKPRGRKLLWQNVEPTNYFLYNWEQIWPHTRALHSLNWWRICIKCITVFNFWKHKLVSIIWKRPMFLNSKEKMLHSFSISLRDSLDLMAAIEVAYFLGTIHHGFNFLCRTEWYWCYWGCYLSHWNIWCHHYERKHSNVLITSQS